MHLLSGRAKVAEHYPEELVNAMRHRLVDTRFADVNKGDADIPDVRSRMVAQDTQYASSIQANSSVETFEATLPLEGLRRLFALDMTHSPSLESCA